MSLLDRGPETVTVYPAVTAVDPDGNTIRRPSATGVSGAAHVQPVRADQPAVTGQTVETLYRVIMREAPASPWGRVVWRGRDWDLVGEPQARAYSPATSHVTFIIRARSGP